MKKISDENQINEMLKLQNKAKEIVADYLCLNFEIIEIEVATEEDFINDKENFHSHVTKLRKQIPNVRKKILKNKLYDKETESFTDIMHVMSPYLTWMGQDEDVIQKLIDSNIPPNSLKYFHFLDLDTLVDNLLALEKISGVKVFLTPLFRSILYYNLQKIYKDFMKAQPGSFRVYDKSKQVSETEIYLNNLRRRLKSNGGNLPKYSDELIDVQFTNIVRDIQDKYPEESDIESTIIKFVSTNVEFEILGIAIKSYIHFDKSIIKGDKKFEVIFDLYKDILKEDFILKNEIEVERLDGYRDYSTYKRRYIKNAIFKKTRI